MLAQQIILAFKNKQPVHLGPMTIRQLKQLLAELAQAT